MTWHVGRLIDHVQLRVRDLEENKKFYSAAIKALGLPPGNSTEWHVQADEVSIGPVKRSAASITLDPAL
ncbi:MAG: VOC family protein [Devosia sp.]|nr:VOC family protein [Devosia sp.]